MKKYESPDIEIISFESTDVITASEPSNDDNDLGWG